MFGYGALSSLILSAQTALLAVMLPADLLGEANSVLQMAGQRLASAEQHQAEAERGAGPVG